jgi:hypothetical protein
VGMNKEANRAARSISLQLMRFERLRRFERSENCDVQHRLSPACNYRLRLAATGIREGLRLQVLAFPSRAV